jgi:hypothetical protein
MFHGHLDYFQTPPLGSRPSTKPVDRNTPNAHNRWYTLFHNIWRPAWLKIHWNNIRLRVRSHMTSHYTWGSVTTLHDFGGVLGRPLDTFFWALTISWSRLLARVWWGPQTLTNQLWKRDPRLLKIKLVTALSGNRKRRERGYCTGPITATYTHNPKRFPCIILIHTYI